MLGNFARDKWRKYVGKMDLLRPLEIAIRELETLAHDGELDIISSQNVTKLPQSLFWTHVRASVTRSVVSGKKQLEFFAWLPALAFAEDVCGFRPLDVAADPGFENVIHHEADPPTLAGQLWYG